MAESCEFPLKNATSAEIAAILRETKSIAVVGLSDNPQRPSYHVAAYLREHGYRVLAVNPAIEKVFGEKAYPSLKEIAEPVDLVDIFRKPEAVPAIVEEAIAVGAKTIWMQEGVVHNAAAEKARSAGLKVVMNKCVLKEHARMA